MALRLQVLGSPLLTRDGRPLDVGTEATALLAYLAVSGQAHAPGELAALCWPGRQDAHATLKRTITAIADTAGSIVRVDGGGVALDGDAISVDHRLVREVREQIAGHGHPETAVCRDCVGPLSAIARLHRGPFLDGFTMPDNAVYDRWQVATADEMDASLAVVLARLSDAHVLGGDLASAVDVTRRLVALDPLREAAHRQLLRLYAWQDRPREALAQYRECVRVLETQLGVSPLDETTRLSEDARAARVAPPSSAATWSGAEATSGTSPAPPVPRHAAVGPLLGREHELGMLSDAMARVNSHGIVIVVEGEAGIGKTSLLRKFAAHSADGGRRVLTAACHAGETMAPFGMLIKLLRSALLPDAGHDWLADLRPDTVRELGRLLPEVATVAGAAPPATGPGAVWRLVDALAEAVFAAASAPSGDRAPGVVIVDDLQWSDQSSLQVLSHLAGRLQGQPVGLVLAWRTELVGRGHPLRRLVSALAPRQLVRQLPLNRLDVDAVRALSAELLGADWDELGGLTERIMEATEGVPQAVADHLAAVAAHDAAPWTGVTPDGEHVLHSTMARLSPLEWQVLTAGAVIGRAFDAATVRRVSGRTHHEIRDALDGLVRAGLLSRSNEGDTTHDVARDDVREFVRAQAGPVRRRLLHGRAATVLERQAQPGQVDPALAAAVASHHHAAGNDAAAALWFFRAGAIASDMLAVAEAAAHYEMALALGPEQPFRVHEVLGDLLLLEGRYSQALDRYEAAVATAVEQSLAALEHKIAGVYLRLGRWILAEQHLATALSALEQQQISGATALGARILTDRGLVAQRRGHDAEAVTSARAALRAAEETGDHGALAGVHNLLGVLSKQDLATAGKHLEQALEHARALRDADIEIAAAGNLAQVYAADGALERALPLAESALARAGQMGDRHREAALRNTLADLLRGAGRNAEAMEHLKRAIALFAEIGEPDDQPPEAWKLAAW